MGYWFYVSHLEVEPITGRERFSIVTPKQLQELSNLEFQAVNYVWKSVCLCFFIVIYFTDMCRICKPNCTYTPSLLRSS